MSRRPAERDLSRKSLDVLRGLQTASPTPYDIQRLRRRESIIGVQLPHEQKQIPPSQVTPAEHKATEIEVTTATQQQQQQQQQQEYGGMYQPFSIFRPSTDQYYRSSLDIPRQFAELKHKRRPSVIPTAITPAEQKVAEAIEGDEHKISIAELAQRLGTSIDIENPRNSQGLTVADAEKKLAVNGKNKLTPPKQLPEIVKYFLHFTNFFMLLLEGAAVLCFVVYGIDSSQSVNLYLGIVLIVIVTITCTISYVQERQTSNVLKSFEKLLPLTTRVVRGGQELKINAENLVVGDIVDVKMGEKIPADLRILYTNEMKVDNSSITGESEPQTSSVECTNDSQLETHNLAFYGSLIFSGESRGVVIRTGDNTLIGKIAHLSTKTQRTETTLQREIKLFVRFISVLAVVMGLICFIIGISIYPDLWLSIILSTIGIIVANVPEGLPATVTACLTITARKLAEKNVYIKKLESVETLGSTTLIASDKTGTLTQNRMTVAHMWYDGAIRAADRVVKGTFNPEEPSCELLLSLAGACNRAQFDATVEGNLERPLAERVINGDASESALLRLCEPIQPVETVREALPKVFEIPFNSKNKWQLSIHTHVKPLYNTDNIERFAAKSKKRLKKDKGKQTVATTATTTATTTTATAATATAEPTEAQLQLQELNEEERQERLQQQQQSQQQQQQLPTDKVMETTTTPAAATATVAATTATATTPEATTVRQPSLEAQLSPLVSPVALNPASFVAADALAPTGVSASPSSPVPSTSIAVTQPMATTATTAATTTTAHGQTECCESTTQRVLMMKGGAEIIVDKCSSYMSNGKVYPITEEWKQEFQEAYEALGGMGERVLGFAYLPLDETQFPPSFDNQYDPKNFNFPTSGLIFVGVMSLIDPPRPGVHVAISDCKAAGIRVIMVTGDHPITAKAIAKAIGIISYETADDLAKRLGVDEKAMLQDNTQCHAIVMHGSQLDSLTLEDWNALLTKKEIVFARTSPEQKLQIVENAQRLGEVVAVTGDGVNDSPALKKADIGVAMGIVGSEVAKEAADVILLDDNFLSIVEGIREGRVIFDNLKKSIAYTLSHLIAEVLPFLVAMIAGIPPALSAVFILIIDLGTEMLPAISLGYEAAESDIMKRPPRTQKMHLVDGKLLLYSYVFLGIIESAAGFLTFFMIMWNFGFTPSDISRLGIRYFTPGSPAAELRGFTYTASYQANALATAQTGYFAAVVLCQWFNLLACRTRTVSLFRHGMKNIVSNLALLVELGILFFIVFVPGMDIVFGSRPMNVWWFWFLPLPFGLLIFFGSEFRKLINRRFPRSLFTRITHW